MFHSSIARVAIAQSLIVVLGVFSTCIAAKYQILASLLKLNPVVSLVREAGFLLLLIPVIWAVGSLIMENRLEGRWDRFQSLVAGMGILLLLIVFLTWTSCDPYCRSLPRM